MVMATVARAYLSIYLSLSIYSKDYELFVLICACESKKWDDNIKSQRYIDQDCSKGHCPIKRLLFLKFNKEKLQISLGEAKLS